MYMCKYVPRHYSINSLNFLKNLQLYKKPLNDYYNLLSLDFARTHIQSVISNSSTLLMAYYCIVRGKQCTSFASKNDYSRDWHLCTPHVVTYVHIAIARICINWKPISLSLSILVRIDHSFFTALFPPFNQ